MAQQLAYALLALLTSPWWGPLVAKLCRDLYEAGSWPAAGSSEPLGRAPARTGLPARWTAKHALAFRPVRPARERLRWEGGFGRRGL